MKISVIIPTHNRADALEKTLACLGKQELNETWEAIVVNNNCTDDTDDIVLETQKNFPVPLRLVVEGTPGPAAARNAGARIARGQYIVFIDNDILTEPDFLQRHIRRLEENPGCWIVGQPVNLPEHQATRFGAFQKHTFPVLPPETGVTECGGITGATTSMRREEFERLGGFDENFFVASGEDLELAMRGKASGIKLLLDSGIVVEHNDWAGTSIRDFCLRQRLYTQTEPFFWKKYGDAHYRMNLVRENLPPNLANDGLRLFAWKNVKRLLASNVGQRIIIGSCEIAEKTIPLPAVLWRLYRMAVAGAIYRGFQEGLAIQAKQNSAEQMPVLVNHEKA